MSTPAKPFRPFVSEHVQMRELTLRALLLGLTMTVILGAANAYLGLRAGITVAATYPAAVISMAAMRAWKGSLLEENISRTSGSIGEGVASGAIFTIPAFLISRAWPSFSFADAYWKSTVLILVGSVLGVLFISWFDASWWRILSFPSRSRSPLRKSIRRANAGQKQPGICSGTLLSAGSCFCSAVLVCLRQMLNFRLGWGNSG